MRCGPQATVLGTLVATLSTDTDPEGIRMTEAHVVST